MPHKIFFITNPNSGTSRKDINEGVIKEAFEPEWMAEYAETKYPGNAREIAERVRDEFDIIVAVGGDGTVHEIASSLIGSETALGIIPRGSGNGLSRSLGLPSDLKGAFDTLKKAKYDLIDTIELNEHKFVNMAGVGFDAHIAHLFKDYGSRGFVSYGKLVLKEFQNYNGVKVSLRLNGSGTKNEDAFVISFANSSQYGNNAHIAPKASITDGLIDVCIMKKFPLLSTGSIALRLFNKSLDKSRYYSYHKVPEMAFEAEDELVAHVDGEPVFLGKKGTLRVNPQSLKVIIP